MADVEKKDVSVVLNIDERKWDRLQSHESDFLSWDFPVAGGHREAQLARPSVLFETDSSPQPFLQIKRLVGGGQRATFTAWASLGNAEPRSTFCLPLLTSASSWLMCGRGEAFASFCKKQEISFFFAFLEGKICCLMLNSNTTSTLLLPSVLRVLFMISSRRWKSQTSNFSKNLNIFCRLNTYIFLWLFRSKLFACWFDRKLLVLDTLFY